MSFAVLADESRQAAARLRGLGVGRGTRVALLCSNRPEWLPIAFGAFRLGAVLVPLSTLWKRDELAYGLRHANVEVLVTLPGFLRHDYLTSVRDLRPEGPALRDVVLLEGAAADMPRWDDLARRQGADAAQPDDPAVVFYTSGTTAQAKAVLHRHAALTTSARRLADCL